MQPYSEKFKRKLVQRMSGPGAISANALSKEIGIPQGTLSRWLLAAGTIARMSTPPKKDLISVSPTARRAEDRSAADKLRLVMEAAQLDDAELGAFLRREGLHAADLAAWRESMLAGLEPAKGKLTKAHDARRVKHLEKELLRKDKALAEAAALLVLQKKAQAIWGDEDDDTSKESDE